MIFNRSGGSYIPSHPVITPGKRGVTFLVACQIVEKSELLATGKWVLGRRNIFDAKTIGCLVSLNTTQGNFSIQLAIQETETLLKRYPQRVILGVCCLPIAVFHHSFDSC